MIMENLTIFKKYKDLSDEDKKFRNKQLGIAGTGLLTVGGTALALQGAQKYLENQVKKGKAKALPNTALRNTGFKYGIPLTAAGAYALGIRAYHHKKDSKNVDSKK